jgi:hypothetical protein
MSAALFAPRYFVLQFPFHFYNGFQLAYVLLNIKTGLSFGFRGKGKSVSASEIVSISLDLIWDRIGSAL